ncbi:J domain-containing protein [Gordonia sputi]|uniref:hypothetical protein n=1 Tax=Gordonia sputi TaxID=36823 RepID=UPI0036B4B2B7
MPDVDLYVIHRLDRRQSPAELAAQLTSELTRTDPRDQLARSRIETARVILGDPQRRARYDRQLDDPSAPEITEQTLAQLSGRPAPTAPSGLFATTKVKVMAVLTVALAIALTIAVSAVACSSGGGSDTTAAKDSPPSTGKPASPKTVFTPDVDEAVVGEGHSQQVRITGFVDLADANATLGFDPATAIGGAGTVNKSRSWLPNNHDGEGEGTGLLLTAVGDEADRLTLTWACDPDGWFSNACHTREYAIVVGVSDPAAMKVLDTQAGQATDEADRTRTDNPALNQILTHSGDYVRSPKQVVVRPNTLDQYPVYVDIAAQYASALQAGNIEATDRKQMTTLVQPDRDSARVFFTAAGSARLWTGELVALS